MPTTYKKHIHFDKKLLIIGFGTIGQAILSLILRHIDIKPEQITIVTKKDDGQDIAKNAKVNFVIPAYYP